MGNLADLIAFVAISNIENRDRFFSPPNDDGVFAIRTDDRMTVEAEFNVC